MARKVLTTDELNESFQEGFSAALSGQSPLSCALIATAFVENGLMALLSKVFIEGSSTAANMLKPGAALGDLAKCADLAYVLGLINKRMHANIKAIGDIRNAFAHSHKVMDFDDPELKKPLAELTLPLVSGQTGMIEEMASTNQGKFSWVTLQTYLWIMLQEVQVKHREKPKLDTVWP